MIKKTLIKSISILKISTWISVIFALFVSLVVAFFITFPMLLKTPIEQQLSNISAQNIAIEKLSFGFELGQFSLNIGQVSVRSNTTKQLLMLIDKLYWQVKFSDLWNNIYYPSKVFVDNLTLYVDDNDDNDDKIRVADIKKLLSLESLSFFKSLNINKTLIKGKYEFETAPLQLSRDQSKWALEISNQPLFNQRFHLVATLPFDTLNTTDTLNLPIELQTQDVVLSSTLKFDDDWVEFNGLINTIDVSHIARYFPIEMVGVDTHQWLKRAFVAGELQAINVHIRQNLSNPDALTATINAHMDKAELLFDTDWQSLKNLDADIVIENKKISIQVNHAQLYALPLRDIKVQIADMTTVESEVEVSGKITSQSEQLVQFLKALPLEGKLDDVLGTFDLSGQAVGAIDLRIPLDEKSTKLEATLTVDDNTLRILDGALTVQHYRSTGSYHQGKITTQGSGIIRGTEFEININPHSISDFAVELINKNNKLKIYIEKIPNHQWQADVHSPNIETKLLVDLNSTMPMVELQNLRITPQYTNTVKLGLLPNDLPNMSLKSKGLYIDNRKLPDFKVDLFSKENSLNINHLEFEGIGVGKENLSFNGTWLSGITTLVATAKGKKLSDFLKKLSIKEPVEGGTFNFDTRMFCKCEPWNVTLEKITGYMSIQVKQGIFTDKDPHLGRILSLLNIKSIAKRLKLEVGDLTSEGFVYDDINASAYFGNSLINLENFELNASSSAINLSGSSNFVTQQYNLLANVKPAIGDAVPIATYLAGGGLAGLGVWLLDKTLFDGKFINTIANSVTEFDYKITGSWQHPKIE